MEADARAATNSVAAVACTVRDVKSLLSTVNNDSVLAIFMSYDTAVNAM